MRMRFFLDKHLRSRLPNTHYKARVTFVPLCGLASVGSGRPSQHGGSAEIILSSPNAHLGRIRTLSWVFCQYSMYVCMPPLVYTTFLLVKGYQYLVAGRYPSIQRISILDHEEAVFATQTMFTIMKWHPSPWAIISVHAASKRCTRP